MKDHSGKILHAQLKYRDQAIMIGAEGAYEFPVKAPKTLWRDASRFYVFVH